MPRTDQQLRDTVRSSPEDEAPRLAYADAIAAEDARRAELIRAQCALAAVDELDPQHASLEVRVQKTLPLPSWDEDLRAVPELVWRYERGFVGEVMGPASSLAKHADTLARHPIEKM